MRKIYSALDIGTDSIKLIVGEFLNDKLNILCAVDYPSVGLEKFEIVDEDALIDCIRKVVEKASEKIVFKIKKVIINIPTSYNNFSLTEASIKVDTEDKKVTSNEILTVLQKSSYQRINFGEELISVLPVTFKIGNQETNYPFGKSGNDLAVKSILVTANKKEIYDFINLIKKCELEIVDITTSGLVNYYNFQNSINKNQNGIIINMGYSNINLSVFNKGIYINNEILNIGASSLDQDIATIYNLKLKDAKRLKERLALASSRKADPKETMKLINLDGEKVTINQYELTEVVTSRLKDMLKLMKKTINHLTKKEISYIIVTGGLTEIKDFSILLNSVLNDSVQIGTINKVGVRNNKYSVALGMLVYFEEKLKLRNREYSTVSASDIELMCNKDSKFSIAGDSILGKIFGYFFDN